MSSPSETLYTTPGTLFVRWHNVMISCWHGAVGHTELEALSNSIERMARLYPRNNAHMAIIPPSTSKITPLAGDDRRLVGNVFKALETQALGIAIAIEASGFVGATTRSILTGLGFLLRRPYPTRTFDHRDAAAAWLLPLARPGIDKNIVVDAQGFATYLATVRPS